ncbi:GNAT family N-acetyltransferase [Paenibacillus xerothermodurans]|uniref:GNAT family N-acetyltransferase n=1 Tax=Paenibacillus xerothermodurans TaxID=1977292 RepID=A0A2W1NMI6_PAEXE|nr:GNAT family N-acetyltransferase [Paenibacillus xerothermodurans]PZE20173.1 GNAT family N-acetyltransferase [Paenibacillus xerothermodurans]
MKITHVQTQQERDDAYHVRWIVFVEEQGVSAEAEYDEFEDESQHVVVYNDDNEPVAVGRWRVADAKAKLERICVLPAYRKYGLGKSVVQVMEDMARRAGLGKAKLHAQTHAQKFYEKLGYTAVSDVFMEEGLPHVAMVKELKKGEGV